MRTPPCTCPAWHDVADIDCPVHGQPDDGYPGQAPTPSTELAVPDEPTGPTGTPLRLTPTPALTFALGYVLTQPVRAQEYGGICALVEELQSRPAISLDGWTQAGNAWDQTMSLLPPSVSTRIHALYQMQRAQRWAATGRRH